jgi:molecular chaperone GrpE
MWPFGEIEFVIDEQPVPVVEQDAAIPERKGTADFLRQVSDLLAENEKLAVTARLLEHDKGDSDEMLTYVKRILPVLDGFERMLEMGREHGDDPVIMNWLISIESLYFRFKNLLEKHGLFGIEAVGQPVNLDLHEVVEYRYSPDHEPETVIAVRQRGYVFRGRLIRDAQVVVARG